MNGIGWLFLYTPFPWLAAMYAFAYRHDLARIARPFRDYASRGEWWSVCVYLGLIKADVPRPSRRAWRSKPLLAIAIIATVSLVRPLALASLDWYYLALFQVASALALFIVLVNRIGRLPYRPYADVLPYPRLGTRIRHLQGARE